MSRRYPSEFHEFMRGYIPGHSAKEIQAEALSRLGIDISESAIKAYKNNHKIRSGTPGGVKSGQATALYPAEVMEYIQQHHEGVGPKEMTSRINSRFHTEYTVQQINNFYKNHGVKSGLTGKFEKGHIPSNKGKTGMVLHPNSVATQFKAGHTPTNKMPIGTVCKKTDGYLWKKLGEGSRDWRQLHILNWEAVHGPIPKGHKLIFLDGNRENVQVENLRLVSNATNLEMSRAKLRTSNADLTLTGSIVAELNIAIRNRSKKGGRT